MPATENRELILAQLDQLPPLHQVAQQLITVMNDERSSARDLDKLIRTDQALTARILKVANSASYGKSREVFKITEAVVLLGHTTLTNLVLGISVADLVGPQVPDSLAGAAWEHSLNCAATAQALAEVTGLVSPENAFVAGLLHDIGLLVQAQAVPDVLRRVLAGAADDPLAAEREAMGLNHPQVGLKILDKWCLPNTLCDAVRFHHAPRRKYQRTNPLINITALADQLTRILGAAPYSHAQGAGLFHQLNLVGVETGSFERLFQALRRSRENVQALRREVSPAPGSDRPTPGADTEISPLGFFAADPRHNQWYRAVLSDMELPLADDPEGPPLTHVLLDFHSASPAERGDICRAIHTQGLIPIVVGDRRHTPDDEALQAALHLPELFTREQLVAGLLSAREPLSARSNT